MLLRSHVIWITGISLNVFTVSDNREKEILFFVIREIQKNVSWSRELVTIPLSLSLSLSLLPYFCYVLGVKSTV